MTSLDCMTNHGMRNCWNAHLVEVYTVTRCTKQIPSLAAFHLTSSHESMVHHSRHGHPIRLNMSHHWWSLMITHSPPHRNQDTQDTSLASFITHHMSPNGKNISHCHAGSPGVSAYTAPSFGPATACESSIPSWWVDVSDWYWSGDHHKFALHTLLLCHISISLIHSNTSRDLWEIHTLR